MRAVIVTNIPTPYRLPVYERVDRDPGVELRVVYLAERERNRSWALDGTAVPSVTLKSVALRIRGRYIHFTPGVWGALRAAGPEVVVTTGFNPPHLVAFAYCLAHRIPHVVQTDGTPQSEERLTVVHRVVRRIVARRSRGFIAASDAGIRLVEQWGAPAGSALKSPLAIDNEAFAAARDAVPVADVDLLFSGQLSEVKDPLFALEVARTAAERLGRRLSVAIVGDGPLHEIVRARAEQYADSLEVLLPGFQQQKDLPAWYARSKVFLFPTHWDPWGLVLNEALAAGVPALVSPFAGSGAELVGRDGRSRVLPLEHGAWVAAIVDLLSAGPSTAESIALIRASVSAYTFDSAAEGILQALHAGRSR